jgi:ABC-type transport system involved in multi-copper enzyme maturation permease subunit
VHDLAKYVAYFVLGGTLVSVSTYFGTQGKSFVAAFVSTFPAITGATFVLLYLTGGTEHLVAYAKQLLWFVPPWLVYVTAMILGVPRLGFWPAMAGSLVVYMACVGLLKLALR